ncbi:murein hydrolase activator EnvC family protein [Streptomyces cuspidosporus]|uniref:M23ase beta-sheet core domain-containing protein n=1 Tax=Streptomyces cuspidosporus TaxID=66882 RepID=A0ABN3GI59_9ACTN
MVLSGVVLGWISLLLGWPAAAAQARDGRSWPVGSEAGGGRPTVLRGWEPPPAPWAAGHRGVDLAARPGPTVRAAAACGVSFAGPVAGRGVLTIELPGTGRPPLRTTYEPVRALVAEGERVRAGQVVGTVAAGPSHCPSGCLHWGLRSGDRYLDPLSLLDPWMLRRGPSRLLPVFGVPEPADAAEEAGGPAGPPAGTDRVPSVLPPGTAGPAGSGELAQAAALAGAAAWAGARLRGARGPGGRLGVLGARITQGTGAQRVGRVRGVRGVRRGGPWRRPPR